jgi:uncharacterized delta-60 repeat protein
MLNRDCLRLLRHVLALGLAWGCSGSPPADALSPTVDGGGGGPADATVTDGAESVDASVTGGAGPPGSLDPSFGSGGKIIMRNLGASQDIARAVAIQADGKILVGGETDTPAWHASLARYLPTGALDTTFGTGGKIIMPFGTSVTGIAVQPDAKIVVSTGFGFGVARFLENGSLDPAFQWIGHVSIPFPDFSDARAVAVQPDGKIVVAGTAWIGDTTQFAVARMESDGTRDITFNVDGIATFSVLGDHDLATSVALETSGTTTLHIVVAGSSHTPNANALAVIRLNGSDGSLDTSFGGTGKVGTSMPWLGYATALAVASDGKIVCGGASSQFVLVRYAVDGSLDPTFGQSGIATLPVGAGPPFYDDLASIALQTDGRIVIAGTMYNNPPAFAVARITADGSLDPSFASGGSRVFHFASIEDRAYGLAIDSGGSIVVVGSTAQGRDVDFAIARFASDGSFDPTFGTGGEVTTPIGFGDDWIASAVLAPDGKLVAVGSTYTGSHSEFLVARFGLDGSPDASFGTGGVVIASFSSVDTYGYGVALQPDGKIVACGLTDHGMVVARYLDDGTLDPSFGSSGVVTLNGMRAFAVAVRADGGIVVAGDSGYGFALAALDANGAASSGVVITNFGPSSTSSAFGLALDASGGVVLAGRLYDYNDLSNRDDFVLARYDATGALDTNFGSAGTVRTSLGPVDFAHAVSLQPDGKILAAGFAGYSLAPAGAADFAVARYLPNGALDPSFGGVGFVTTDFGGVDEANAMLLQPDGKIVLAGGTSVGGDFAMARYTSNGSLDPTFGGSGLVTTSFGFGVDLAYAIVRRPDGRLLVAGSTTSATGDTDLALAQFWP